MLCQWDENRTCVNCGWHFPHDHIALPRTSCPHPSSPNVARTVQLFSPRIATPSAIAVTPYTPPRAATIPLKGPGDFLHDMIRFWFHQSPTSGCGCDNRIVQMNAWGPTACKAHIDEITGWLLENAKKQKWKLASAPGAETIVRLMVRRAIRKADRLRTQATITAKLPAPAVSS